MSGLAKLLEEGRCRTCGKERYGSDDWGFAQHPLTRHHLVPKRHGGRDEEDNIVPLCFTCHKKLEGQKGRELQQRLRKILRDSLTPAEIDYCERMMGRGYVDREYPEMVVVA